MLCLCSGAGLYSNQSRSPDKVNADIIVPGQSVGPLKLGDAYSRAKELFPFKRNMDQEWQEEGDCGTTFNWLDMNNSKMLGNLFVRFKDDKVFQIDSGTSSFRTQDGITIPSSPQEVRKKYRGLRAYILSEGFSEATGERPLVYWVDSEHGIAFGFTYSRRTDKRYLSWIVVFKPHTEVCPQYGPLGPSDKWEIPAYSLETGPR
jgi:hypothetical protein